VVPVACFLRETRQRTWFSTSATGNERKRESSPKAKPFICAKRCKERKKQTREIRDKKLSSLLISARRRRNPRVAPSSLVLLKARDHVGLLRLRRMKANEGDTSADAPSVQARRVAEGEEGELSRVHRRCKPLI
jgi:hypothetical protein